MIDTMFQDGTDKVLDDQMQRPRLDFNPKSPSIWQGFGTSAPRGIGAGVSEMLAFGAEMAGMFGDVMGSYPELFSYNLTDEQKKQGEATRRKLLTQGPSASSEAGDIFRARAKEIMPDPATTGVAGQLTAGVFNFGAKALGYTLTTGPAAPFILGGDVGMTEADKLKQEGVDLKTRTEAASVAGGAAALSLLVPMSGATAAVRAAKGVAVGEGTMIGQSAAEKAILKAQGYDKIADSYDPLDPVALAVGAVPGALGAKFGHAAPKAASNGPRALLDMGLPERQALSYNDVRLDAYAVQAAQKAGIPPEVLLAVKNAGEKSGPTATSPAGAQGVMQFMPSTWREFGRGDPMDPMNSIDAGAAYLKKLHEAYGSWDAAVAHYNGGGAQAALVRGGGVPSIPETASYLKRVQAYMGKTADEHVSAAVRAEPDLVDAARVLQAADAIEANRLTAADDIVGRSEHVDALERASDQLGRGEPVTVGDRIVVDQIGEQVRNLARAADDLRTARVQASGHAESAAPPLQPPPVKEGATDSKAPAAVPPPAGESVATPAQATIDRAAAQISTLRPDLMVHLDGMEAPVRVSDLLESVRKERADTMRDSKLVQVAAACALHG